MNCREFSANNHASVSATFYYLDNAKDQLHHIWKIEPKKITMHEFDCCLACEIIGKPETENDFHLFLDHVRTQNLLDNFCMKVSIDGNWEEYFFLWNGYLDCWKPGVLFGLYFNLGIDLNKDNHNEIKKYTDEEEAFFSQFKKEVSSNE